jgi:hypothetical protein
MSNAVALLGYRHAASGSQDFIGIYQITLSGSYTQTTGESVNLLTASNTNGLEGNGYVPSGTTAEIDVLAANAFGFLPQISAYSAGAFTMQLYSGGTEHTASAYTAGSTITIGVPHRF